jgi:hypothetical protein
MTRNPDAFAPIGELLDFEGEVRGVRRDFDCLDLPSMTLSPAGVRDLERRILPAYWNALARYRLRELDFDSLGVDLDDARADLSFYPGLADADEPGNLELVDWCEVGRRLAAMRPYGGDMELRKLHALLTAVTGPLCDKEGEIIDTHGGEHYWHCDRPGTVNVPSGRKLCEDHAGELGYGPKQEEYGFDPNDGRALLMADEIPAAEATS